MTDTILDVNFIRQRQRELGIRVNDLAAALGTTGTVIRLMTGHNSRTMTVAGIANLADVLGVPPARLFRTPDTTPHEPEPTSTDVATLGAALATIRGRIRTDRLAAVLGWTTRRLTKAEQRLNAQLQPVGQRIVHLGGSLGLDAQPLPPQTTTELRNRERRAETGLNATELGLLLDIAEQRTYNRVHTVRLMHLRLLRHLGLVDGSQPTLTAEAREAFLYDEIPDVPHHNLPAWALVSRTKRELKAPHKYPMKQSPTAYPAAQQKE